MNKRDTDKKKIGPNVERLCLKQMLDSAVVSYMYIIISISQSQVIFDSMPHDVQSHLPLCTYKIHGIYW